MCGSCFVWDRNWIFKQYLDEVHEVFLPPPWSCFRRNSSILHPLQGRECIIVRQWRAPLRHHFQRISGIQDSSSVTLPIQVLKFLALVHVNLFQKFKCLSTMHEVVWESWVSLIAKPVFIWGLDGSEWSASWSCRFSPGGTAAGKDGWEPPGVTLDVSDERDICFPCRGSRSNTGDNDDDSSHSISHRNWRLSGENPFFRIPKELSSNHRPTIGYPDGGIRDFSLSLQKNYK